MADYEIYGSGGCPYTRDMREWLEWNSYAFVEYDIDADPVARERLRAFGQTVRTVPVLVEAGAIVQIGWRGRGCVVSLERRA